MEAFLNIVKENYLFFVIVSVVLLLSLVGYIVDKLTNKEVKIKQKKSKKTTLSREETVELLSSTENQSINEMMNKKNNNG